MRIVRFGILLLLIAGTAAAALFLREIDRREADVSIVEIDGHGRFERLAAAVTAIAAAHQGIPGQIQDQAWVDRMAELLRRLRADVSALTTVLRAPESGAAVKTLLESIDGVVSADLVVLQSAQNGQPLMAADVLSGAQTTLESIRRALVTLQTAELSVRRTGRAAMAGERWNVLGAAATFWLVGALLLLLIPVRAPAADTGLASLQITSHDTSRTRATTTTSASAAAGAGGLKASATKASSTGTDLKGSANIDLSSVAELCVAFSRVSAPEALPSLLSRTADLLDASGIVLWMGAGEELFPVTAHGYRPQLLARLDPLHRTANNATATAWREGRLTTVAADGGSSAVVAPMFGPDACVGVLAIEVPPEKESDSDVQAATLMLAAQLAASVAAWPAPSAASATRRDLRSAGA